ncbi:MAG: transcription factor S [Methanobrevibacter sp.]|nr:transcription factor S [Candidatus Methanoflexus mossambicus]
MKFCPKCGSMLKKTDNTLICRCGYEEPLDNDSNIGVVTNVNQPKINSEDKVVMKGEELNTLPTTNELCPNCGNTKAGYKLIQTRSADEAPTRIFTCTKCKHTWRAYD